MKPIFIFGLPRSGTTLLQRIISNHPKIKTTSEPWILLPVSHSIISDDTHSWYNHLKAQDAIKYFLKESHNKGIFYEAIREFSNTIYKDHCNNGEKYFLDKTPRYYAVIDIIFKVYNDAKYIFLFRNPLAIMASISRSWRNNKLSFKRSYVDLFRGPKLLANGYENYKEKSITIFYKNLVRNPSKELKRIYKYLNINYCEKYTRLGNKTNYPYGDKIGNKLYDTISEDPLEKWKSFYNTKFRTNYAIDYINFLGEEVLETFDVDKTSIISTLHKTPKKFSLGIADMIQINYDKIWRLMDLGYFIYRLKQFKDNKDLYPTR